MSRYDVKAIHADRYRVIVGWDNPLQTLFGQIWDWSREEEEACILWVGSEPGRVRCVDALAQALAAYAVLPAQLAAELEQERAAAEPPTPLQKWVLSRYTGLVTHWQRHGDEAKACHT